MHRALKWALLGVLALAFVGLVFWWTQLVSQDAALRSLIEQFGVLGIFLLALLSGFNVLVPVHVATFTPLLITAGFSLPVIITTYVLGTTAADLIGYFLGRLGKTSVETRYQSAHIKVANFIRYRRAWVMPGVFLYSAFAPLPNEVLLIPLGLIGFELRKFIIPLILGTILHHTIFALGSVHIFELIF